MFRDLYFYQNTPTLLAQNVNGFNLIGYHDIVYAIPQPEGAFDINRVQNNGYSRTFQGPDIDTVTAAIKKAAAREGLGKWKAPTLLEENIYGFNLIGYRNIVYGIPQPEGIFSLERVKSRDYSQVFEGLDVESVKNSIRKAFAN